MRRNLLETIIGGVVLLCAGLFLYFAYTHSTLKPQSNGYTLMAKFDRIDGLLIGSDVRMSGVKVGSIINMVLDPESYLAVVHFSVKDEIKLPEDSSASVQSDGLLGDKYLSLTPGGSEEFLQKGEEVVHTQSAVNLTDLIGQAIFNSKKDDKDKEPTDEEATE